MSENTDTLKPLLDRMVEAKQLSAIDADAITRQAAKGEVPSSAQSEDDILRWLATEYAVAYTALDDVEPDRQLLSLFPARILLKEQLLPLRRTNGTVEVATSRLFATQGLDALKTMTGLKLKPVLAPREAIEREIKKRLGVGADTIGTLDEETAFEAVAVSVRHAKVEQLHPVLAVVEDHVLFCSHRDSRRLIWKSSWCERAKTFPGDQIRKNRSLHLEVRV